MADFMPLTSDVRNHYITWGALKMIGAEQAGAEFDRWLAEHDRQVSEAAWSRGRTDSTDLALDGAGFRVVAVNADNPYSLSQVSGAGADE